MANRLEQEMVRQIEATKKEVSNLKTRETPDIAPLATKTEVGAVDTKANNAITAANSAQTAANQANAELDTLVTGFTERIRILQSEVNGASGGLAISSSAASRSWNIGVTSSSGNSAPNGSLMFSIQPLVLGNPLYVMFVMDVNGRLGIGTETPSHLLTLSLDQAAKPGSNTWTVVSDVRVKEAIEAYTGGLAEIALLNPVRFRYTEESGLPTDPYVGLIAQEVEQAAPQMVERRRVRVRGPKVDPETQEELEPAVEEERLFTNTGEVQYMLINAVKELLKRVETLETEVAQLRRQQPSRP